MSGSGSLGDVAQTAGGGGLGGFGGGLDFSSFDFSDHSNMGPLVFGVNVLFLVLIPTFTTLRIYVRFFVVRKVGWDDALLIAAAIIALPFYALNVYGVTQGLGRHVWDLLDFSNILSILPTVQKLVLILWINNLLYSTSLACVKCSIVACYMRVFPGQGLFRKIMWADTAVIIALWITSIFVGIFQCIPPSAAWVVTYKGAKCFPIRIFYLPASSVNIVTDLVLCSAPLPILWKLRVSKLERIVVLVLFGFGFFATAASIARLVTVTQYVIGGVDFTRYTSPTLIWSGVEIGVGIICATVPALRPILKNLIPSGSYSFSFSWKLKYISSRTHNTSATSRTVRSSKGFEMLSPRSVGGTARDPSAAPAPAAPGARPAITVTRISDELEQMGLGRSAAPTPLPTPEPQGPASESQSPTPGSQPTAPIPARTLTPHDRVRSFSRPLNAPDVQWRPPAQWDVEQAPEGSSGPLLYPLAPQIREPQTRLASRTSFYDSASESLGLKDDAATIESKGGSTSGEKGDKKELGLMTKIYEGSSSSDDTFIHHR